MSVKNVSVEVSSEMYDVGQGLVAMAKAMASALKDGWQPGQDIPVIAAAAFQDLLPAISAIGALAAEAKASRAPFIKALELCVDDIVEAVVA